MARKTAPLDDKPTKENNQAGAPQNSANQSQRDPRPRPTVRQAEVDVLRTLVDEYKARDTEASRLQRRNFRLGVITVVLVFVYTTVAAFQWCAMLNANNNATKALQTAERPYVALGDRDGRVGDFVKTDSGIPIALKLYFFNSGHEPATNVTINLFAFGPGLSQFRPQHIERWKMVGPSIPVRNPGGGSFGNQAITIPGESAYTLYRGGKWMPDSATFQLLDSEIAKREFEPEGTIEYCDRFGEYHCMAFGDRYLGVPFHIFIVDIADQYLCPRGEMSQMSDRPDPEIIRQPSGEIDRQVAIARCPQPDEQSNPQ
jgi:hypothetical protein